MTKTTIRKVWNASQIIRFLCLAIPIIIIIIIFRDCNTWVITRHKLTILDFHIIDKSVIVDIIIIIIIIISKIPMIQIKRIPQTVQAPRKNARPAKIGNMQMDPMKMFPTNQPPTLLRVQPDMQYAPMRGSMYPVPIPKLHRTTEKSFPPPCPFILRSARNVDAPMYLAARQTQ